MPPGRFLPPPPGGSFYALPLVVEEQHGGLEFLERIGEAVGVRGNDLVAGDVRDPCHAAGQADGVRAPGAGVEHHPGGVRGKDDIRVGVDVDARRPVEAAQDVRRECRKGGEDARPARLRPFDGNGHAREVADAGHERAALRRKEEAALGGAGRAVADAARAVPHAVDGVREAAAPFAPGRRVDGRTDATHGTGLHLHAADGLHARA